jgi:hypothetical protein
MFQKIKKIANLSHESELEAYELLCKKVNLILYIIKNLRLYFSQWSSTGCLISSYFNQYRNVPYLVPGSKRALNLFFDVCTR